MQRLKCSEIRQTSRGQLELIRGTLVKTSFLKTLQNIIPIFAVFSLKHATNVLILVSHIPKRALLLTLRAMLSRYINQLNSYEVRASRLAPIVISFRVDFSRCWVSSEIKI